MEIDRQWRKSTYSTTEATCLEVAEGWVKSSRSANQGQCVEASRPVVDTVYVQDSKDPGVNILAFTGDAWTAFVTGVKNGEFDG